MRKVVYVLFVLLFISPLSMAGEVEGRVVTLFNDYPNYGWCMAKIDFTVPSECDQFISFGCDGQYIPKAVANGNFQLIQLAYVTGQTVKVGVREDLRYNVNFCLGQRVDIIPLP